MRVRLREWRLIRALTQEELGQLARVGRATISRIEGGTLTPRPSTVKKLAAAFGLRPEDLFRSPDVPPR